MVSKSLILCCFLLSVGLLEANAVAVLEQKALDVKYGPAETLVLKRVSSMITGNKETAVSNIVSQYKMLIDSSKALNSHASVVRSPVSPDDVGQIKKTVVQQLRSKIDTSVLKTAHSFAQQGPLRSLIEKTLDAKVSWAKEEGTQLKRFLALNAKEFEVSLEKFFESLSITELYRLVCELKALLEALHDAMPNGTTLLADLKAHMIADREIIKNHSHPVPSQDVVVVE